VGTAIPGTTGRITRDGIAAVVAHHARRGGQPAGQDGPGAAAGYRPESLRVLFGQEPR